MKTWHWIILTVVILGVACVVAWPLQPAVSPNQTKNAEMNAGTAKVPTANTQSQPKGKPLPMIGVEIVKAIELNNILDLTGTVTPTRTARIASPGEGPVEACATRKCIVREGDSVKKGQILLQIGRHKTAQAQLAAAEQTRRESETELRRIEQLVQGGAIPGAQLDVARSAAENARAQHARALESAQDYTIAAPWNGIVSKVHVAEGDYVAPRTPLVEIFDPTSLVVQFSVPEAQSTLVRRGLEITVLLDAHPGQIFPGEISRVFPQLDNQLRTRTVEGTLAEPVDLIPGMFARVQVLLARFPDALTVPVEAVVTRVQQGHSVFVLQNDRVEKRKVQTGIEAQGRIQILSGIKSGEQVVVEGYEKLKDGTQVQVRGDKNP